MKLLWTFCLLITTAFARERIGKVTAVQGSVQGDDRTLTQGAPIFTEEVMTVSSRARVQLKFTDGSLVNLTPNTQYRVNEYSFNDKRRGDRYAGELIQGGFRHVTGAIAKRNPDLVTIDTPTATIGVRGTVIEAYYNASNGTLFVGCQCGTISVANSAGDVWVGPTQPFQYIEVSTSGAPPQGLSEIPSALQTIDFSSPYGGVPTSSTGAIETGGITIQGGC